MSVFRPHPRHELSTLPRIAAELAPNDELVSVNPGERMQIASAGKPPPPSDDLYHLSKPLSLEKLEYILCNRLEKGLRVRAVRSRNALPMTETGLNAIAALAIIGLSTMPSHG